MKLQHIVTLANRPVRLQFLAMERSLRATGCDLPLLVIPFNDDLFELPKNATWWKMPEMISWLDTATKHPMIRKYQCLTLENYQFVDSDICFLRNPEQVLLPHSGFVTCCCEWRNTGQACVPESLSVMSKSTTVWQRHIFNAGQFACDKALYTVDQVKERAQEYPVSCLLPPTNDQIGLNLLVFLSGIPITNLTMPPTEMESSWAIDYADEPQRYWSDPERKPYILHWAGLQVYDDRPVSSIFYSYLSASERAEFEEQNQQRAARERKLTKSLRARLSRVKRALIGAIREG
jgi:hypothetical protein